MLTCPSSTELEEGIYLVVGVTLRPPEGSHPRDMPPAYPPPQATIFEVVDGEPDEDPQRVGDTYRSLLEEREKKLSAGVGEGPVECGALVFVKDIYMTQRLHGGHFEVKPHRAGRWGCRSIGPAADIGNFELPTDSPTAGGPESGPERRAVSRHTLQCNRGESIDGMCRASRERSRNDHQRSCAASRKLKERRLQSSLSIRRSGESASGSAHLIIVGT